MGLNYITNLLGEEVVSKVIDAGGKEDSENKGIDNLLCDFKIIEIERHSKKGKEQLYTLRIDFGNGSYAQFYPDLSLRECYKLFSEIENIDDFLVLLQNH